MSLSKLGARNICALVLAVAATFISILSSNLVPSRRMGRVGDTDLRHPVAKI